MVKHLQKYFVYCKSKTRAIPCFIYDKYNSLFSAICCLLRTLLSYISNLRNAKSYSTLNKGPSEWGELLGDPAITAAILDRIIHRSEVIQLGGDSYRLKHRQSIFNDKTVQN